MVNNKKDFREIHPPTYLYHLRYPPPVVPSDFTGQHAPLEDSVKSMDVNKESVFSFEERGLALGEKPIEHRSVFDYIPKHSKDRLDQAIRFFVDSGKDKSQLTDFPSVPKDVALLALKGFMPFGDNPKKQERYRNYLENHAGMLTEDGIPKKILPIPEGLTYDAAMKEMDEFAKAARIFRPISAMMSGRFTSASDAAKNVEVVSFEGGLKTEEQYRKEKEERAKAVPEPEKKQVRSRNVPLFFPLTFLLANTRSRSGSNENVWRSYSYSKAILS